MAQFAPLVLIYHFLRAITGTHASKVIGSAPNAKLDLRAQSSYLRPLYRPAKPGKLIAEEDRTPVGRSDFKSGEGR